MCEVWISGVCPKGPEHVVLKDDPVRAVMSKFWDNDFGIVSLHSVKQHDKDVYVLYRARAHNLETVEGTWGFILTQADTERVQLMHNW